MTLADVKFNIRGTLEEQDDILRCLRNLIMTPAGTVPLDRDFGINNSFLGEPLDVAQNLIAIEIIEKIHRYEPRVGVLQVDLEGTIEGLITAKVVITNG